MEPLDTDACSAVLPVEKLLGVAQQWYLAFAFSERACTVADRLIAGMTTPPEIADALGISPQLVHRALQAMFRKTGVVNRMQLVVRLLS